MADAKMVNLTIEGRPVTRTGRARRSSRRRRPSGVLIPHYCYHPGLPVAGVCRMCLVEVEKAPKLAPACATSVAEGQVVHVHSEKALEARKGVLEMLLINHPLDCPICDQAGECELQDYTYQEGRAEAPLPRAEALQPGRGLRRRRDVRRRTAASSARGACASWTTSRTIRCSTSSERGDRALIGKFEGQDLTHPWAGNVIDLCPVGALLSKDFLNKARAWELDRTASVCPSCSQGCNMIVETRDNVGRAPAPAPERRRQQVLHVRPRPPELPLDEPRRSRSTCRWCGTAAVLAAADWEIALARRPPRCSRASVRSCSRRRTSPTKRCSCSARLVKATGGAGRVPRGAGCRGAAAGRRGSRASRRSRRERPRRGAAGLRAQRHAAVGDSAPVTCSSSPTTSWPQLDAADAANAPAR